MRFRRTRSTHASATDRIVQYTLALLLLIRFQVIRYALPCVRAIDWGAVAFLILFFLNMAERRMWLTKNSYFTSIHILHTSPIPR